MKLKGVRRRRKKKKKAIYTTLTRLKFLLEKPSIAGIESRRRRKTVSVFIFIHLEGKRISRFPFFPPFRASTVAELCARSSHSRLFSLLPLRSCPHEKCSNDFFSCLAPRRPWPRSRFKFVGFAFSLSFFFFSLSFCILSRVILI